MKVNDKIENNIEYIDNNKFDYNHSYQRFITYQNKLNDKIKNFYYWSTEEGRKERASLGGKAHKGKKVMHLPGTKGWKRILPEDVDMKLNEGWKFGTGEPAPNSKVKK
mgnify:CR=1 FL=1